MKLQGRGLLLPEGCLFKGHTAGAELSGLRTHDHWVCFHTRGNVDGRPEERSLATPGL